MGSTFNINIPALVQYLKHNSDGPNVIEALRCRTMIHYLHPELDPLANQVLGAYHKISEIVELPFNMLDAGCMCGFLKHYLDRKLAYPFRYVGIDQWPEAIEVAKEFHPHTEFHVKPFFMEDKVYDYVCVNNIQFGKEIPNIIMKATSLACRAAIFGMPKHCGDYASAARELGFEDIEQFDCGESTVVKVNVNGNNDIH